MSFTLNSLPVADLNSPNDANGKLAKMIYTAGAGWATPRMEVSWVYTDAQAQIQSKYELEIALSTTPTASGGSASSTLITSGEVTSGASTVVPVPLVAYVEGNYYFVRVRVWDGMEWSAWDGWFQCRVRWGLTTHAKNMNSGLLGVTPTAWSVASLHTTEPANTDVVLEYNSSSAGGTPVATWKSDLGLVLKADWVHYRAWFLAWGTSPVATATLDDIVISVSGFTQEPDFWLPSPISGAGANIEQGTYVFGTQSLQMIGNGTERIVRQQIRVEADTDYTLQGRMGSLGASGASIRLSDTFDGPPTTISDTDAGLAQTTPLAADTPFTQFTLEPWNSRSRTTIWIQCRINGAVGTGAYFDGLKIEKGRVASSWNPAPIGALPAYTGSAAVLDGGGVQVDASQGGKFRLRTSGGNIIELGATSLELDGEPIGGVPAGVIMLWSGQTTTIPTGWALCDGTNGTPDLRDRFVIGADTTNEGTSGGTISPSAALTTHTVHGDHKHAIGLRVSGSVVIHYPEASGLGSTPAGNNAITLGGGSTTSAASGFEMTELTHDAHAVYKFYRLAYIMKL